MAGSVHGDGAARVGFGQRLFSASARSAAEAVGDWACATADQDATLIESHKRTATTTDEGYRGYRPMLAIWADAGLILADESQDGNVAAQMEPLRCARAAVAALPTTVTRRYFQGDSACYAWGLMHWLNDAARAEEPDGLIGFAIRTGFRSHGALREEGSSAPALYRDSFDQAAGRTFRGWHRPAALRGGHPPY